MAIEVLFIHSAGSQVNGQGSSAFVEHLRTSLGAEYKINSPNMPDPEQPSYQSWKDELKKQFSTNTSAKILIGHSLGGSVLLKYLSEEKPVLKINGLFIVASPFWGSKDWTLEEFKLRNDFAQDLTDVDKLYLYQSTDDEVVPIEHLFLYSNAIANAKVRKLNGGGHTFKNGLAELVQDIKSLPLTDANFS